MTVESLATPIPCKTVECQFAIIKVNYHVDGAWFKLPDGSKVWKGAGLIAKENTNL